MVCVFRIMLEKKKKGETSIYPPQAKLKKKNHILKDLDEKILNLKTVSLPNAPFKSYGPRKLGKMGFSQ